MTEASGLEGDNAPPARSMIPRMSMNRELEAVSYSQTTVSSTLKRLISELGRDAYLLDRIPIAGITMVQTSEISDCLPHKILLGSLKVESEKLDAWAFLSTERRTQNDVPRMLIYTGSQSAAMKKHTCDRMDDYKAGSWCETFRKVGDPARRSVFVKTCFILKGAELPSSTQFTATFLKELKTLCRSFMADNTKAAAPTPSFFYQKPMMARKTQSIGPDVQLFSLPVAYTQEGSESLAKLIKSPPTVPAAMRWYKGISPSTSSNPPSSAPPVSRATLTQATKTKRKAAAMPFSVAYASKEMGLKAVDAAWTPNTRHLYREPLLDDRLTASTVVNTHTPANSCTGTSMDALTAVLTTALTAAIIQQPETSDFRQSATNGTASYQAARSEMSNILEELGRIEAAALANKKKYTNLRNNMKYSIDVGMKERHKAEIKTMLEELAKKHKAEEGAEKAKYRGVVAEYECHRDEIDKKRDDALLRKSKLGRELKRKREVLSREELLVYIEQDADEKRTQKRVQT